MDRTFWTERLAKAKAQLASYDDAIMALTTGGVQQYTLDTGQTRQTVTKLDIEWMQKNLDSLENKVATLEARLYGCGTSIGRPGW